MIKGVNMQVIEVTDASNKYYDRAFLVVKPEYMSLELSILEKEGKKLLKEAQAPSTFKPKSNLIINTLKLLSAAISGAGIAALFILI